MDESFTAGGFSSTQGGSGAKTPDNREGVAPLVIEQIHQLGDDGIKIFGFAYGMVSLVAIVRNVEQTSTKVTYKLEDHTGSIEAHYWLEEDKPEKGEPLEMNQYAHAYGMPKTYNGQKVLMLFKIFPVKSANAVTTHLLEVMHARFQAEQYQRQLEGGGETTTTTTGDFMDVDSSNGAGLANGLKGKHLVIYQAIKGHGTEEGISVQQIHQKFKHIPIPEIRQIAEAMSLEGHIYSSIDTDHYLPTE
ncbi:replication protein A 32 kDa subunit [Phlebotomus argentipes]|uniref:replication protein A 32 kDa subunit n=1 Tax=Phlebotomus argentipes TaxID=94469 RepID=UPI00289328A2|nr:replication protein A 32 kDa subunit [Phlebotomus argentipes]XP_059622093.1 replication protein A 32 kDa subunit [Phlebotomus argentipes]